MERHGYQMLKQQMLRTGDTLVIMSLDRLGRNKNAIKEELRYFMEHDIRVRVLDLPTTNFKPQEGQKWVMDMVNNILIEVLASQAEQERISIRQRQAEGIAIAKAEGKFKGRQPVKVDKIKFEELYRRYMSRKITKTKMAQELDISRPTLDKTILKYKNQEAPTDIIPVSA